MTTFHNPSLADIRALLRAARTIAVVSTEEKGEVARSVIVY